MALIAAITASVVPRQVDGAAATTSTTSGKRKTVLAVTVPGKPPYAVLMPKLKHPRRRGDIAGAGLPALVWTTDPNDVEILWDELRRPSIRWASGSQTALRRRTRRRRSSSAG